MNNQRPQRKIAFVCHPFTDTKAVFDPVVSSWKAVADPSTVKIIDPLRPFHTFLADLCSDAHLSPAVHDDDPFAIVQEQASTPPSAPADDIVAMLRAFMETRRPGCVEEYVRRETTTPVGADAQTGLLGVPADIVVVSAVTDKGVAHCLKREGYFLVYVSSTLAHRRSQWLLKNPSERDKKNLPPGEADGVDEPPASKWMREVADLDVDLKMAKENCTIAIMTHYLNKVAGWGVVISPAI